MPTIQDTDLLIVGRGSDSFKTTVGDFKDNVNVWTEDSGKLYPTTLTNNVGIGTDTPAAKLEVSGEDQTTSDLDTSKLTVLVKSSTLVGNSGGSLGFGATNKQWAGIKGLILNGNDNSIGDLSFSTRRVSTDSTLTEAMRIRYNGNLGIGTDTPAEKLHVNGKIRANDYDLEALDPLP